MLCYTKNKSKAECTFQMCMECCAQAHGYPCKILAKAMFQLNALSQICFCVPGLERSYYFMCETEPSRNGTIERATRH